MGNETRRTLIFGVAAIVTMGAAYAAHRASIPANPPGQEDLGTEFYADFKNPNAAHLLRVVAYDEPTASRKEFKVEFRDGRWRIPSHHDYPADAKDRLAKTASSVISLTRGSFITRRKADHARYNVIDPEDEQSTALKGRGQKITLSKGDGEVLAEYIVGKKDERQPDAYYVGAPRQDDDAVYLAKFKIDLSTKFGDWIESDLLKMDSFNLTDLRVNKYQLEQRPDGRLAIIGNEVNELTRASSGEDWKLKGLKEDAEEVQKDKITELVNNLDNLRLVGVRPKPKGVQPDLGIDPKYAADPQVQQILMGDMFTRGFLALPEKGSPNLRVYSKEGELAAGTNEGVRYSLNFGEVFTGSEFEIETGLSNPDEKKEGDADKNEADARKDDGKKGAGEKGADEKKPDTRRSRYLMVYATFDPALLGERPKKPTEPVKPEGVVLDPPAEQKDGAKKDEAKKDAAKSDAPKGDAPATKEVEGGADPKKAEPAPPKEKSADEKPADDPPAKEEGKKQSSLEGTDEGELLALAFQDSKEGDATKEAPKKEAPKAGETRSDEKAAEPAPPKEEPAKSDPGKTDAKSAPKQEDSKSPPAATEPPKPDPKAEYLKALDQHKKDVEKYENDNSEYDKKITKGKEKVKELNDRFGPWYYVISAESFENLSLTRTSLVKPKEKPAEKKEEATPPAGETPAAPAKD